MANKQLGDLLVEMNLITEKQLKEALRVQTSGHRRLGSLLIKMKLLTEDQLLDALISQQQAQVFDIKNEISPAVKNIVPRYLCYKYGILPLSITKDNILKVAMVDPSDREAIRAIEDYSSAVVDPGLAREHEIREGIKRYIPFSIKDIVNPQSINNFSKVASLTALVAIVIIAVFSYRYLQTQKYGTMSQVAESTLYKNHDIMINVNNKTGIISLLGHAAYADGTYSVSFKTAQAMHNFVDKKKKDFSQQQYEWITLVVQEKILGAKARVSQAHINDG